MVSGEAAWQGRHACVSATAAGGLQGLQALSPRRWPPLGAFIKLPALRVVHDCTPSQGEVIRQLNPVIRGWAHYYRTWVSKAVYARLDALTWAKHRSWAHRRHPT